MLRFSHRSRALSVCFQYKNTNYRYGLRSLTTGSEQIQAIASQSNGYGHGNTIYAHSKEEKNKFLVKKVHQKQPQDQQQQPQQQQQQQLQGIKPFSYASLQQSVDKSIDFLADLFLPRNYATSVTKDYWPYIQWHFIGATASSAAGVLSMQSLLYAIGLGAGSIPTAAAVNWVLKDGLGQFGGVLFASVVNNRYDADPKRWRTVSAVSLDLAILVEVLTPMFPTYFLPMASIANMAKNISWLSASATRAGFHNSFAKKENLADITAKAGSQSIASSIVGTGLGIVVSQMIGNATLNVLVAFSVLSSVHLLSVYRSLSSVSLRTLNLQRLHLVSRAFLTDGKILGSDAVSEQEVFLRTLMFGYKSLYKHSSIIADAPLNLISSSPAELLKLKDFFQKEKYLLNLGLSSNGHVNIYLALERSSSSIDALKGHLHASLIQSIVEERGGTLTREDLSSILKDSYNQMNMSSLQNDSSSRYALLTEEFIEKLQKSEWHIENLLVEEKNARFKWL